MFAPAIACGATVISVRQFSASTFWRTANDHRATVIFGAGAVGMLLLAQPADDVTPAPPSLRHALLTPMNVDAQLDFENRFGVPVNCSSYGQTECTCISISTLGEDIDRSSAGRPLDTLEVRVVDGDDVPVPAGEVGEIVVRPRRPDVMFRGYWDAPDATIEAWRNLWHHTGDVGRLSGAGELYIVDRKTDSMRHRGENVSSLQIEGAIMRHDAIASVAAHSVPSDLGEDEIKVCIVLVTGTSVDRAELFDFFKQSLPYFAVPRFVEIMDQLPVNAIGRVLKQDLRNRGVTAQTWDFQALGLTVSRSERRGAV
jgi:crotonobetaine/carnitine-CoA ligase